MAAVSKSGCDIPEERAAFLQHRKNVRRKAIEWRLSLNEWRALWRVSGRWSERGRGPAKYGMTRVDFDQAVEPGNVEIMTNREAVRRARLRVPVRARHDIQQPKGQRVAVVI